MKIQIDSGFRSPRCSFGEAGRNDSLECFVTQGQIDSLLCGNDKRGIGATKKGSGMTATWYNAQNLINVFAFFYFLCENKNSLKHAAFV